jgi:formamidopyrimidine-DNA glycosylase
MSGQLLLVRPGEADARHLRVRFDIGADRELWFVDQRTFGGLFIDERVADGLGGDVPAAIAHIARDPLDPFFDDDRFLHELRTRHTGIKRALLDQTLISGVGNIYADEALWRSRLHFDRPCHGLSAASGRSLLGHVRDVMEAALSQGGTSFDALYVNVNGESGYFDRSLDAYGREGEPCHRCGRPIVREAFMNRSSYRCPRCQRRPQRQPQGGPQGGPQRRPATSESLPEVRSQRR